ncbi:MULTISPECIES: hypothetical protein [Enterococcus]|uniref:Uncharacterized protein n=1 Tax=Enterococcus mundtii TaxID=53346 RepID=A0A1L8V191_ENTMU|nr:MULTISPECIES: hypothetical protein [Enterococcus]MZU11672.1 hypothetical protein [Bifidobacterium longum]GEN18310.1 hypothetical protein LAC02_15910 [Ligilactobacillus acidipiscis]AUB53668.1 hypothetical protein EM4838_11950 [Enterococcus mundtii]EOH65760.1 hypothetical protein UAC_00421 [Enterococcus mundtii ATCC 882]EOU13722.1 hypothetical protein I587_02276 [Enterococcus mundtii ATCC 882]
MSDLEHKEEKALDKIVATVNKLDKELNELDTLSENPEKKHNLKKWLVERKAIHEIKKILHEADKYEKYDEKELDKEFKEINDLLQ